MKGALLSLRLLNRQLVQILTLCDLLVCVVRPASFIAVTVHL
jgi:hypothetical protein